MELEEIKRLFDQNYTANQTTREKAADDRVFAWVSQWDDGMLEDSQLSYRGEFNLLRKATRQIIADLRANPVQVDFQPLDDTREDGAEVLDGMYLTDDRRNSSQEAYENAYMEAVDCGVGGWELYAEYETNNAGDRNQVIRRRPMYEANNVSFPDANAKRLDKSDAMNWGVLEPFSEEGYKRLYKELTGEETDANPENFASPEQSYTFPWVAGKNEIFYIVRWYQKEKIKDVILTLQDPLGNPIRLRESDLTEIMDELIDQGYEIIDEKKITRWQVKRYICSGEEILKEETVPGDKIPVVLTYGERTFVEGEEIWEGVVRLAKDPQRLRNFMLSYLADMVSRSPRKKPMFYPEQVAGFEFMYEENGADNNYPYYLMNRTDPQGNELPPGPPGYMEGNDLPNGMSELVAETRNAINDVADAALPNDFADLDLSGKAIMALQNRLDQQSLVYQQNLKHAKRWDAEIYAAMASVIYDAPRKVTVTKPDGTREQVQMMDMVMDDETGELRPLNDITNLEFEVYADIGPSYESKKEQTREELGRLAEQFKDTDPNMHKAITLMQLQTMDGVAIDDLRDYANKQLLLGGFKQPDTDEEREFLQQAMQQEGEPDANMLLAQAEMQKAQADQMQQQREAQKDQWERENNAMKTQIDFYKAQTDRQKVNVSAAEAGVESNLTQAKIKNTNADTLKKMTESFRGRVSA